MIAFAWAAVEGGRILPECIGSDKQVAMMAWLLRRGKMAAVDFLINGKPSLFQTQTWFDNHREGTDVDVIKVEIRDHFHGAK